MKNEELTKILNTLHVPAPSEEAKNNAIQSAMAVFRMQKEKNKNRVKGFTWLDRLISKKPKGGFFMNRTIAISTAGLAATVIVFAVVFSPTMTSQIRRDYAPVAKDEMHIQKQVADELKQAEPSTATSINSGITQPAENKTSGVNISEDFPVTKIMPTAVTKEIVTGSAKTAASEKKSKITSNPGIQRLKTSGMTEKKTTAEKNEFTMDEIVDTVRKRENIRQEVPPTFAMKAETESPTAKAKAQGLTVVLNTEDLYIETGHAAINPEYVGRDRFEDIKSNSIKLVSEEPVSTFSVDVDTASYTFVRRALNSGHLPQADSVRVEEMINYFDYNYPFPKDKSEPFKPTITVLPTPWNADTRLLHIGIKGYDIVPEKKPSANLVFLIDVSGSMQADDKLPLLKNSLRMLVETLNPNDTVAIVTYAGSAAVELDRTGVSDKTKILAAIDRLRAGGSTAGAEGIRTAYSIAEAGKDPKGVNRVILATDGDFNVGITDTGVLHDFIARERKSGIYLSVLGFGQGNYNDELMQKLAQNGNGNAAYIDNLNEARKVLVDEASGTLFTIAKDVKIQVEFNPNMVSEYRLIGYETRILNREDFKNDNVDAGDIGSGHSVTAIYEITPKGSGNRLIDDLRYGSMKDSGGAKAKENGSEYAFLKIRYKLPDEDSSREISTPIDKTNEYKKISDAPSDSRFASAVAAFGQLLRGDAYINRFTYDDVIALARDSIKVDPFGYRTEFLNLVRLAETASPMGER